MSKVRGSIIRKILSLKNYEASSLPREIHEKQENLMEVIV